MVVFLLLKPSSQHVRISTIPKYIYYLKKPNLREQNSSTCIYNAQETWNTEDHVMVHKRFGWQMRAGRKQCRSRLNFGTSLLWTASTSRGHAAVTGGKAPVNGGWHNILRRVLGMEGEGRWGWWGGQGRTRRCGVIVMSARVKWNHR